MTPFRDIKRKARRDLHQRMLVPALYIASPGANPLPVTVRVHSKFVALGDQKGTNFNSAEREDIAPRIIFMADEVPAPVRNAIVSVAAGEAYEVETTEPRDDITITAFVVQMPLARTVDLPLPGDAND